MRQLIATIAFLSLTVSQAWPARAQMTAPPMPLLQLRTMLANVGARAPGRAGVAIKDLASGYTSGYNMNAVMPAASTIKIPIMVEVFRQMAAGTFDLNRRVELLAGDRDWGSGDIADSPVGSTFPVSTLLTQMITVSDNTAANMLIRLVGRSHINETMADLGLHHTHLADYIHTEEWSVRTDLRTTPADMVRLLGDMAKKRLIDAWSSQQMIAILEQQEINTLLPEPLPQIPIAHKTGSFDDTLNDVGIVYADSPYVIAVLTTDLSSLPAGRNFIRTVSLAAYTHFQALARWREANAFTQPALPLPKEDVTPAPSAQSDSTDDSDVPMWATPAPSPSSSL